jgi:hypothetical protein
MAESDALRQHLLDLLRGRNAHADFDAVLADFPSRLRGVKPPGAPHTGWQLLEHMRIAQWDIVEFSRAAKHKSPAAERRVVEQQLAQFPRGSEGDGEAGGGQEDRFICADSAWQRADDFARGSVGGRS